MKRLALAFCLLAAVILATAGFTSIGHPAVTRLLSADEHFMCSGTYIDSAYGDQLAVLLTAGHCVDAHLVRSDTSDYVFGYIDWRVMLKGRPGLHRGVDLAVGTVPDVREKHEYLHLAEKMPTEGFVYIHGFPLGVEKIAAGRIVGKCEALGDICPEFPGSVAVAVWRGEVQPGSSGSAVLDEDNQVVGVVWGLGRLKQGDWDIVLVTPVEEVHKALALLQR